MRIRSKWLNWLLGCVVVLGARCLFLTLRKVFHTAPGTNPYATDCADRFIYCTWHDQLMIPIFGGKHEHTAALVSQNQDGGFVVAALRSVGILPIRGSSSRGGVQAMRQLLREAEGNHIVITPDGPRGPRRQLSPGIVFLAAHAGRRIVPTAFASERGWRIGKGWTDLLVPMPFSRLHMLTGEPIEIPSDVKDLRAEVARVQALMDEINARADALAAGKPFPQEDAKSELKNAA